MYVDVNEHSPFHMISSRYNVGPDIYERLKNGEYLRGGVEEEMPCNLRLCFRKDGDDIAQLEKEVIDLFINMYRDGRLG
jgi:hypothetical protein